MLNSIQMLKIITFILILIFLFVVFSLSNYFTKNFCKKEMFSTKSDDLSNLYNLYDLSDLSFNVITLNNHDRLVNILEQESILPNISIAKFNAINGKDLNQNDLIEKQILSPQFSFQNAKRSNEIACYLSHMNLLKSLKNSPAKYHIILEDDFKFIWGTNFLSSVYKSIEETSGLFDIIFLGWETPYTNESEQIYWSENIFKFAQNNLFYGTYGYMVNSNSIDKIINLISIIQMPIDTKFNQLYSLNQLNLYWLKNPVIEPNYALTSTILSID